MQFERDPYAHDFAFLRFWVDVRTSLRILLDFIFSKVIVITATFIDLLSDLLFCVLYCVDLSWAFANLDDPILDTLPEPKWLWISRATETYYICVSFAIVNIVIWFCGLMVSHHKIRDTFSVLTLVHVLTSFPFLIGLTWPPAQNLYIPYYLRAVITVDRLRAVLRLRGTTRAFNFSAVTEKGILLFGSVLTVVYLGVCTYQYVEYRGGGRILGLPSSFYFVIVTLSTVGYGDVAPETVAGQVVVIGLILVALSVVPSLIAQLVETIANSKTAENEVFIATRHPHVVVIGNFDIVRRLIDVLEEVTAHSSLHQRILFLSRTPATPAVQSVISHIKYKSTVSFIVGSGTETRDLERAQLLKAAATYVLADRGARDLRREDDMNTLRVWGIHKSTTFCK
ncbi:hypothetical protein BC830DRAFT_263426 [Chytriomyces sp. MP71]|nr:hypothetical protein BC830DRAFT_263426 [Chytriomyces sp. MP71]